MKLTKKVIAIIVALLLIFCIKSVTLASTVTVDTETLNLRETASTDSAILKLLNRGEELEVLAEEGDWYRVQSGSTTGYVHKDYVAGEVTVSNTTNNTTTNNTENTTEPTTSNNTIENSTSPAEGTSSNNEGQTQEVEVPERISIDKQIDIYILPLINSERISRTVVGETVEVLSVTNNWLYVSSQEVNGWIVKSTVIDIVDTTVPDTNVDTNTDTDIDNNTDTNNDDNNTTAGQPGTQGQDVQITEKTMYVNSSSIYIRRGPSTDYDYIDSLILNSSVIVTAENGDWYKVRVSGIEGYIAKRLLSDTPTTDTTSRGDVERDTTVQSTTSTNTAVGDQIVTYAKQFLGCKYVYGGSGPSTFDCSGFTMYVYSNFGVSLSHSATAQSKKGTYVAKENLQPGDLVFFKDYETMDGIGHCGIYIGNGDFIHASSGTGYCVKISTLLSGSYLTRYETARRVI